MNPHGTRSYSYTDSPVRNRTKRTTVTFLVDGDEHVKVFRAEAVVLNANGTLSVHLPESVVTFNVWVTYEVSK